MPKFVRFSSHAETIAKYRLGGVSVCLCVCVALCSVTDVALSHK